LPCSQTRQRSDFWLTIRAGPAWAGAKWRRRIYEQIQETAKAEAGVNRLCQITGLSRAGYYRFRRRQECKPEAMELREEFGQ
jgi:hypothetical protein